MPKSNLKKLLLILMVSFMLFLPQVWGAVKKKDLSITADHTKFKELKGDFHNGEDLTNMCLKCHNLADKQIYKTFHWTWKDKESLRGKGAYTVNNWCISTNFMHDEECSLCHIGWKGKEEGINCFKCHLQTKEDIASDMKDYLFFSQSQDKDSQEMANDIKNTIKEHIVKVGPPTRRNCGECHFKGGHGDGAKHGDLDTSLINPSRDLDVHMSPKGGNFSCVRCHTTVGHNIAGRYYTHPAVKEKKSLIEDDKTSKITCVSCHGHTPHKDSLLNGHIKRVACQSCHIPAFARKKPTELLWDWSTAGKKEKGRRIKKVDKYGKVIYGSDVGTKKWATNVIPTYFWYNGTMESYTLKDTIDPTKENFLNKPIGSPTDKNSKIFPFKIHRGKQPYDKKYKRLLPPLLSEDVKTGEEGYWKTLDWQKALKDGCEIMKIPYSGEFGFVKTSFAYPINHMVAPKENAVKCIECHTQNGRLKNIRGIYLPGRDRFGFLDNLAWTIILLTLVGVIMHGIGRLILGKRRA